MNLKRFFHIRAQQAGLDQEVTTINWSVGFCQSDFVEIKTKLSAEKLKGIIGADFPQIDKAIRVLTHLDCFPLVMEADCWRASSYEVIDTDYLLSSHEDCKVLGLSEQDMVTIAQVWRSAYATLQGKMQSLARSWYGQARELRLAGLTEDTLVRSKTFGGLCVNFYEIPDDDFDMKWWDQQPATETIDQIIAGDLRYMGLRAIVLDVQSGTILGQAEIYGTVFGAKGKLWDYGGHRHDLVCDALDQVRKLRQRLMGHAA